MTKILFAVDGSEASLRAARGLAGVLRWCKPIDVEVVNVQPESSRLAELLPHALRERAEGRVRAASEEALATARALLHEAGAACSTSARFGDPAPAIAHAAETLDCALIAMGSHGAGAVGALIAGSVVTKVIQTGVRPVLVLPSARPAAGSAFGPPQRPVRILLAVDASPGAAAAVHATVRVAAILRDPPEIHLLTAYENTPLDVEVAAMVSGQALADYQHREFEIALKPARAALAEAGLTVIEHTAVGPAAAQIRATVADEGCDLVCLGTRGTSAIRNLFVGSTATKVLHAVDTPLLLVPPAT
jgi:nucleotide-binding universal stress UspA family protein